MPLRLPGRRAAALFVLLLGAGCSSAPPDAWMVPDHTGLYATRDGEIERIDGDEAFERATWDRRQVTPAVAEFVVFQEGVDMTAVASTDITLRRVGWVRSRIAADGSVMPNDSSTWDVPAIDAYVVPVNYATVAGRSDTIRVSPLAPLAPGLYSLELRGAQRDRTARIGVDWPSIDRDLYASAYCLDRVIGAQGGSSLQPCTPQVAGEATQEEPLQPASGKISDVLQIELQAPQVISENGADTLIVHGQVLNSDQHWHVVPEMVVTLIDAQGARLEDWTYRMAQSELAPGEVAPFTLRIVNPAADAARVHVDFVGSAG